MPSPDQKVSVVLTGGQDEAKLDELAGPIASQGAAITLRASRNTRLTQIPGTCVRAPNAALGYESPSPIHSVVSSSTGRNALALQRLGRNVGRVLSSTGSSTGTGAGPLGGEGGLDRDLDQEAFVPTRLSGAGALASSYSAFPPATAYEFATGLTWHATASRNLANPELIDFSVQVVDAEGGAVVKPQVVAQTTAPEDEDAWLWCGLTTHGAPQLWVLERVGDDTAQLVVYAVQVNGNGLLSNGTVVTGVGFFPPDCAAVCSGELLVYATLDSTWAGYAFFVHRVDDDLLIRRIDVGSLAVVSGTAPGTLTPDGEGERVAVTFSRRTSGAYEVGYVAVRGGPFAAICLGTVSPSTLLVGVSAEIAPSIANFENGPSRTAASFFGTLADGNRLYAAVGYLAPTGDIEGIARTVIASMNLDAAEYQVDRTLHKTTLASRGATLRFSETEFYPLWELVSAHTSGVPAPSDFGYVTEPAVMLYLQGAPAQVAPVARYGVVRGMLGPARTVLPWSASSSLTTYAGKARATYVKDEIGFTGTLQLPARWVEIDFNPHQAAVAHDRDGVALVAGALVAQWDGYAVSEFGPPFHRPDWLLCAPGTGGSGDPWAEGTYQIGAYYSWTDAAGIEHRSATILETVALETPQNAVIVVAPLPVSLRTDLTIEPIELHVFVSEANGVTLHRVPERPTIDPLQGTYDVLLVSPGDPTRQIMYSRGTAGDQQMPQSPPPLLDAAIVGDRCWGLDGEIRSRIVHSKRRVSGHGFEFHPAYEALLPSGAGRAVAVREWQGSVVVFTEYGIFQISGDGPDNLVGNPSGGSFSKPIQLAYVGARSKESVVSTPVGIFFQRDDDIMLFTGGAPVAVPGYQPEAPITGVWHIRDAQEVVFFDGSTEQRVYNYETSAWTTWSLVEGQALTYVHPLGYDPSKALVRSAGETPSVYLVESASLSQSAEMSWETGWLLLAGDFQDRVLLRHVLLSARRGGAHGLRVEIFTNHEATPSTTRSLTAQQITDLPTAARYTIRVQPARQDTTAVKIRITETEVGGDRAGMRPVALTLVYALDAQQNDGGLLPPGAYL